LATVTSDDWVSGKWPKNSLPPAACVAIPFVG
jgi:hypothetical protein